MNAINPDVPVYDVATMEQRVQDSMARQRFAMTMLGGFAGFAMILAAIGIYGVMSFLVTQGTADIAIRMALGARRAPRKHPRHGLPTGNGIGFCGHHRWTRRGAWADTYDEQSALRRDAHRSVYIFLGVGSAALCRAVRVSFPSGSSHAYRPHGCAANRVATRYTPWNVDATIGDAVSNRRSR